MSNVLVIGAGNGGFATAADLAIRKHQVVLYNRSNKTLEPIRQQGGIRYTGTLGEGLAPLQETTQNLQKHANWADLVLVCLPALAHQFVAKKLAPYLSEGQYILLSPGGMMGSLAFLHDLRAAGFKGNIQIAETGTLPYICRKLDPGNIHISSVLHDVPYAAFPAANTKNFTSQLSKIIPYLRAVSSVLEAGFANVNAILHPPGMILGAAWIEHTGGNFYYYLDAATPAVANLLKKLDLERIAIGSKWGVHVDPFPDLFANIGSTSLEAARKGDYLQTLLDSQPNHKIMAPQSLDHRYMHEDIPFGLAPIADLGRIAAVPTPAMNAVIEIASITTDRNYWSEARTLTKLGLGEMKQKQILQLLQKGTGWI